MTKSGLRTIEGLSVLPMDGLWQAVEGVEAENKITQALEYSGCNFFDNEKKLIASQVVALTGIGGTPIAYEDEDNAIIKKRIEERVEGTREIMASSAAFSYLNSGEKALPDLYEIVTGLGHYSIAHTVQVNFIVAGISEGTELELNLQRDLVHLSKVTNTRSKIQNSPPIVLRDYARAAEILEAYGYLSQIAERLRIDGTDDTLEFANSMFPVNKATLLMLSGDLSNLRKLSQLRHDKGKEIGLREVAQALHNQLSLLWPEIISNEE